MGNLIKPEGKPQRGQSSQNIILELAKERKLNNYHISKATKSTSLTLVFLELQGVVLRQTIAKSVLLFTYEKWHLFNLRS